MCSHISTSSRRKDGTIVPVVFDKSDFEPQKGETAQSLFFADPDRWLDVLESDRLGSLRLNFAHFGGEDNVLAFAEGNAPQSNWTGKIIRLMERFPNVYADIAYCPDDGMLEAIDRIMSNHEIVKKRLMFGTDFVMVMMNKCGLRSYFDHYKQIDHDLVTTNPLAFLT